jgi:hypothetical protein
VRLVIADTGPINYLVLIGHIDLLPRMFDRIAVPRAAQAELSNPLAPFEVRRWMDNWPAWLEIQETSSLPQVSASTTAKPLLLHLQNSFRPTCCSPTNGMAFARPGKERCLSLAPWANRAGLSAVAGLQCSSTAGDCRHA